MLRFRLLPAFGSTAIGDIRPIDVREFMSALQGRGLSASSCRQTYHLLGMILRAAVEDGRLVTTPCVGIKLPRLPQTEMAYLSPPELRRLLEVIPSEHRLLIEVLAIGGLRFGEAVALRRFRVDLERSRLMVAESLAEVSGVLHFGAPKTHQRRAVTLPRFLRDRLGEHLKVTGGPTTQNDDLVFQASRGGPIRYNNFFGRIWKPTLVTADLPEMGIHALRHTCAALLISQGAHPKAIQSHLGHRSITTTLDRYGHLFEDEHEKLADRIDAAYAAFVHE
jgi:integrase